MKNNMVVFSESYNYKMKKMRLKDKRLYTKTDNTILLDKDIDFSNRHIKEFFPDLKNIALDEDKIKKYSITIYDPITENIYINNQENLGGITLPYKYLLKNNVSMRIYNFDENINKNVIKKLNIILNDRIETIYINELNDINIKSEDRVVVIIIKTKIFEKKLIIDENNIKENFIERTLTKLDIKDNIIDLRDYNNYDTIRIDRSYKVDNLIITKNNLKNYKYVYNALYSIHPEKLIIIDEDDMKLNPNVIEVIIKDEDRINYYSYEDVGWFIFIKGEDSKIIYIDKFDNLKIIDKCELEKEDNVKSATILYSNKFYSSDADIIMLKKLKNGTYEVRVFDEKIKIDILFKKFLLLNLNKYNIKLTDMNEYMESSNWLNSFIKDNSISKFLDTYDDYVIFKDHINKLIELGFSYKALTYLYDRKIDSIINTKTVNYVDEIDEYEVDTYNKLGEHYVKQKRLKRGLK